jgi:membrane-bound metal-dependent hydrolase YbcI (DUF457 family)
MDILTHTLSGMAAGGCLALYAKKGWKEMTGIFLLSGFGSALPDIDTISLWPGFDDTLGKLFALDQPGKDIYSAKLWYSHHGFMHSLTAALLFMLLAGFIFYLLLRKKKVLSAVAITKSFYNYRFLLAGFFFGFCIHLSEDMVTPAGSWGGVRLFFPLDTYIGGTGDIWWWNNYDVLLVVSAVLVINLFLLTFSAIGKMNMRKMGLIIFAIGCITSMIQIKTRNFNFNNKVFDRCEGKSKTIQKEILGEKIYNVMERFDKAWIIYL